MNFFPLSVIDSDTTDLNLMEHHPCPLCGVSHLAHPNRLNGALPNIISRGLTIP